MGKPILDKFGADLPFLPKILSIAKALPLQIHPDKDLAAKLHKKDPEKYGDSNHKPEIAVALSKFEVFVGFKPLDEIKSLIISTDIFGSRLNRLTLENFDDEKLKAFVTKILLSTDEDIKSIYEKLRSMGKEDFKGHDYIPELLPRLAEQYGKNDPGNLVALLTMNYLVLEKGDTIYVPAE